MLDSGSAFRDETLTIRFATLENPENFGPKYPAAHQEEITANLHFRVVAESVLNSVTVGLVNLNRIIFLDAVDYKL